MELIDREKTMAAIRRMVELPNEVRVQALSAVSRAKAVDAKPVVHGRWEQMGESDYKCSLCGFRFTSGDPIAMFPYCRCGAQMDGGAED